MENVGNRVVTTLAQGFTAGALNCVVTSGAGFPSVNFRVIIDNEIFIVTNKGAGLNVNWTITPASENTTPADHQAGAKVTHVFTAGALEQFVNEHIAANVSAPVTTTATDKSGTITTQGTAQTLMAANANRYGFYVDNLSNSPLQIGENGETVLFRIPPKSRFISPEGVCCNEQFNIVGQFTGQKFSCTEFTCDTPSDSKAVAYTAAAVATITTAGISQSVFLSDGARKGVILQNRSDFCMYYRTDGTAATIDGTSRELRPDDLVVLDGSNSPKLGLTIACGIKGMSFVARSY